MDAPAWQVWVSASALVLTGAVVASGIGYAGYAYGRESAPSAPTALAEKAYASSDLTQALGDCGVDPTLVTDGAVTLLGKDYPAHTRQCVAMSMGATPRAIAEFSYDGFGTPEEQRIAVGSYEWSNVTMTWKQTETGRDLTIRVGDS